MTGKPKLAIIGAGLSGLVLARALQGIASITVFEKSRGLGGRMSTRRAEGFAFDHGAQFFSARGDGFADFLAPYLKTGVVQQWSPRLTRLLDPGAAPPDWSKPRYVAVPGMTALAKAMAEGLDVHRGVQIADLTQQDAQWHLRDAQGEGYPGFDWVISTAPALQTARLMPPEFAGQAALDGAKMLGCYSLMLGFETPLALDWDAAWVGQDPLAWIAVDSTKPGRGALQSILVQSSNTWAEANLERDQDVIRAELLAAVAAAVGQSVEGADYVSLHRWRYASVATPAGTPCLIDADRGLAAAGDWCGAGKIEAAFDSAGALATALKSHLATA